MTRLLTNLFFEGVTPSRAPRRPVSQCLPGVPARAVPSASEQAEHDAFYHWLFERAGLSLEHYRSPSLHRRLPACLRALGAESHDAAKRAIELNPRLLSNAVNAVLLGVTEFYRDAPVFQALEHDVLPKLVARREKLRVWSAACSEGQELYSVAFLLSEHLPLDRCELVGTDFRADAITAAAAGRFAVETASNLPPTVRDRYFTKAGRCCEVQPWLRAALQWKCVNLFDGVEPGPWDLVLWRNMSIYLTADAQRPLWHAILEQIRPGGYLLVGKADHPPTDARLRKVAPCIYQWQPGTSR